MSFKSDLLSFAKSLEKEDEAAFNLWTWTPSHHFAKIAHDDYCDEFMPSKEDIMKEVSMLFGVLSGYTKITNDNRQWFICACEECELKDRPDIKEIEEFISYTYSSKNKEITK